MDCPDDASAVDQEIEHAWAWSLAIFILSWYMQVRSGPRTPSAATCLLSPDTVLIECRQQPRLQYRFCCTATQEGLAVAYSPVRAQIHPGHAVLEKRRPALMDSLVQACPGP